MKADRLLNDAREVVEQIDRNNTTPQPSPDRGGTDGVMLVLNDKILVLNDKIITLPENP